MDLINKKLIEELNFIFNKYASENGLVSEIAKQGFVFSEVEQKKVLFVGINPSYTEGSKPENYSYKPFDSVKNYPQHYKPFQDIADNCNFADDWSYLDLFYFRETDQNTFKTLLNDKTGLSFICDQLRVTIKILEEMKPALIVVCNSFASSFFGIDKHPDTEGTTTGIWMGYEFIFSEKLGVNIITGIHKESVKSGVKSTKLTGTPVLFTSALKYMATSNMISLKWHIRQILNYQYVKLSLENYPGSPEKLIEIIKTLAEKVEQSKQSKIKAVADKYFEYAANYRDDEKDGMEKIMRMLRVIEESDEE